MENYSNKNNVIIYKNIRVSILTERLVRVEYSKEGKFEDRYTQIAVNRAFDDVKYTSAVKNGYLEINTS